jgi:hypothetical protein
MGDGRMKHKEFIQNIIDFIDEVVNSNMGIMPDELNAYRDELDDQLDQYISNMMSQEYAYLKVRDDMLTALENAGVDNWEWYTEAIEELNNAR